MKAKTHKLVELILAAIGPVFKKHDDYDTIFEAMNLVMARVIQATPDKGKEFELLLESNAMVEHALEQYLKLEETYAAEQEAKKAKLKQGVAAFDRFALNGNAQPLIEPGSAADYPDNPNQNIAKTVAPFRDQAGNLTQEGLKQIKQDVVDLHTPDEYTPGEGPYSQDPEPPELPQEASGQ
jgi:hypothetical protein